MMYNNLPYVAAGDVQMMKKESFSKGMLALCYRGDIHLHSKFMPSVKENYQLLWIPVLVYLEDSGTIPTVISLFDSWNFPFLSSSTDTYSLKNVEHITKKQHIIHIKTKDLNM